MNICLRIWKEIKKEIKQKHGSKINRFRRNWIMSLILLKLIWPKARSLGQRPWKNSWVLSVGLLMNGMSRDPLSKKCSLMLLGHLVCSGRMLDKLVALFWTRLACCRILLNRRSMIKLLKLWLSRQKRLKKLRKKWNRWCSLITKNWRNKIK